MLILLKTRLKAGLVADKGLDGLVQTFRHGFITKEDFLCGATVANTHTFEKLFATENFKEKMEKKWKKTRNVLKHFFFT